MGQQRIRSSVRRRHLKEHLQPLANNRGFVVLKAGDIASGSGKVPDEAAAYGSKTYVKTIGVTRVSLKERGHGWSRACDNDHKSNQ